MSDEGKFWLSLWTVVVLGVLGFALIVSYHSVKESELMLKAGYDWKYAEGHDRGKWIKAKPADGVIRK